MPLVSYKLMQREVYHVDLNAPPGERWRSIGRELGNELHALLQDVVELCEERLVPHPR